MARSTTSPARSSVAVVEPPEQRRTLMVLVTAQVLSGAGLAAGITVGALLAQDMLGATSLAGLPSALFTIGSAGAAVTVGRVSQRAGRRAGLSLGYVAGALGSVGVVVAAVLDSVPLLFAALFVYGAGTATNLQARYAGADLAAPSRRGRAVSTVLVATTLGAVVGPNLVTVMGAVAAGLGIPRLAGPFILAAAAYGAAGVVLWVLLRPDPLVRARELAATEAAEARADGRAAPLDVVARPRVVLLAGTVMVVSQLVMVAIMTMTPVHMLAHGHGVAAAGLVIAVHVGAMYLPSPLSGWLVDRFGALPVSAAAGVTLLAAGVVASTAPAHSVPALAVALALLGLGWSLGLVSGTAMLGDAVPLADRAKTQGSIDLAIAVAGAGGGMASGFVVASTSYATLSLAGGVLALAIVAAVAVLPRRHVEA
ncbi:MFS transporter [Cellulomonas carbonis]|uniref:MFS transporter n=1 Tax=Cellulomonas carbonis T26 TaxID=947969 RepID=A0A0A0BQZ4_9CELL|nr:MFS transporter [Cellulomonas carbonis]KGM10057.1 MFS transporter [Cellulomonas carbonis T26]GGC18371.1 putative MFS-type transporter YdeG [Cellulomonas carbonis]